MTCEASATLVPASTALFMRRFLPVLPLLLVACRPEGAWQPTLSASPGFESGIAEDRFVDACSVRWDSLLVGIHGGSLLDETGTATVSLPGNQVVELGGIAGRTLAHVQVPAGPVQSLFSLTLRPPDPVISSAYSGPCPSGDCGDDGAGATGNPARGNATEEQRASLVALDRAGQVTGLLDCGASGSLVFDWEIPHGRYDCPLADWELVSAGSTASWVEFRFQELFGGGQGADSDPGELQGLPWLALDLDSDGVLSPSETDEVLASDLGLGSELSLADWFADRFAGMVSIDGEGVCAWDGVGAP